MINYKNFNVDVIGLEWTSTPSRDRDSAALVCNYLRIMGVIVKDACVWDGLNEIYKTKAKLIFMTNSTGAFENYVAMKYAKNRGMLGVSLVSEGIFKDYYLSEMIWGWNSDKLMYEDINIQWSEKTQKMTLGLHPELHGKVKVSGGVGFDYYKIYYNQNTKQRILDKYKKNFKKVIGVGCWDFGWLYPKDTRYSAFGPLFEFSQLQRFKEDAVAFDDILSQLVERNPDTLFILKEHPGNQLGFIASGIIKSSKYQNVLVLKNEESIMTCIQAADIWIVYESTTAMEAWLLGKPSCLLNPSGHDFPRDKLYKGSPVANCAIHLQEMIDEFYTLGEITRFKELAEIRNELIKESIQWDDGLNHVRVGNEIIDLLNHAQNKPWKYEHIWETLDRWRQHIKWLIGPYLRKSKLFVGSAADRRSFSFVKLEEYQNNIMTQQKEYYKKLGLSLCDLRQIKCQ